MDNRVLRLAAIGAAVAAALAVLKLRRSAHPPAPSDPPAGAPFVPGTGPDPRVGPDPSAPPDPQAPPSSATSRKEA